MLLNYPYADYSTDIWSLGCVFAAMLYRRSIYFTGGTPTEQLLLIANVSVSHASSERIHIIDA